MSSDSVETPTLVSASPVRVVGRVKWFNNKAGYGFITVTSGDHSGSDIFVHHSGIKVSNEQYKYLVQGEYVEFLVVKTDGGAHEYQAGDVSGIALGKLMCETRREFRETRPSYKSEDGVESAPASRKQTQRPARLQLDNEEQTLRQPTEPSKPRARGSGPREGEDWTLVKKGGNQGDKKKVGRPRSKAPPAQV